MKARQSKIPKNPDLYVVSNNPCSYASSVCSYFFICVIFPIKCEALEVQEKD